MKRNLKNGPDRILGVTSSILTIVVKVVAGIPGQKVAASAAVGRAGVPAREVEVQVKAVNVPEVT